MWPSTSSSDSLAARAPFGPPWPFGPSSSMPCASTSSSSCVPWPLGRAVAARAVVDAVRLDVVVVVVPAVAAQGAVTAQRAVAAQRVRLDVAVFVVPAVTAQGAVTTQGAVPAQRMGLDVLVLMVLLVRHFPLPPDLGSSASWSRRSHPLDGGRRKKSSIPFRFPSNDAIVTLVNKLRQHLSESAAALRGVFRSPGLRRIELAFLGSILGIYANVDRRLDLCVPPRRRDRGRARHVRADGRRRRSRRRSWRASPTAPPAARHARTRPRPRRNARRHRPLSPAAGIPAARLPARGLHLDRKHRVPSRRSVAHPAPRRDARAADRRERRVEHVRQRRRLRRPRGRGRAVRDRRADLAFSVSRSPTRGARSFVARIPKVERPTPHGARARVPRRSRPGSGPCAESRGCAS